VWFNFSVEGALVDTAAIDLVMIANDGDQTTKDTARESIYALAKKKPAMLMTTIMYVIGTKVFSSFSLIYLSFILFYVCKGCSCASYYSSAHSGTNYFGKFVCYKV
jgi:hypothetical protein